MRILVLVTDAFGGRGGIAKFNRNLLTAELFGRIQIRKDMIQRFNKINIVGRFDTVTNMLMMGKSFNVSVMWHIVPPADEPSVSVHVLEPVAVTAAGVFFSEFEDGMIHEHGPSLYKERRRIGIIADGVIVFKDETPIFLECSSDFPQIRGNHNLR